MQSLYHTKDHVSFHALLCLLTLTSSDVHCGAFCVVHEVSVNKNKMPQRWNVVVTGCNEKQLNLNGM